MRHGLGAGLGCGGVWDGAAPDGARAVAKMRRVHGAGLGYGGVWDEVRLC